MPIRFQNNITGATGEYYVAAELSRRGAIATITLKNTPNADVLAASAEGKVSVIVQVKTRRTDRGTRDWPLSSAPLKREGRKFFYIFVTLKGEDPPDYYIVPRSVVAKHVEPNHQAWRSANKKRRSNLRVFKQHDLLQFEKYHNNWAVLGLW